MKRPLTLFAIVLALAPGVASAQEKEAPPPCSAPEFAQFDFWVGEWNAVWEGGKGTNTIRKTLGGCVIEENFDASGPEGNGLVGKSVSTYDPKQGVWRQTWVDNEGGYLDFTGGFKDGKMMFTREAEHEGKTYIQRMVWQNITHDAFDWNWQRSVDGGKTWKDVWVIRYTRKS